MFSSFCTENFFVLILDDNCKRSKTLEIGNMDIYKIVLSLLTELMGWGSRRSPIKRFVLSDVLSTPFKMRDQKRKLAIISSG